ncbi:MAG: hypothetical protein WC755_03305 [Candidatus Woesearchaeota archaeon]|jgi:hypothetical protein
MKRDYFVVFLIFLSICTIRVFLSLSVPEFASDSSYQILREVEHITKFGTPIIHDDLSYLGRDYYFLPVFHYILAFFSLFFPLELVCKIVPNIFASLTVFIVYFIGLEIAKNREAVLFTAFMSGIVPVFLSETVYSLSVYSLVIPVFLMLIYCLIKITKHSLFLDSSACNKYKIIFIILIVIFSFLHQSVILFVLFFWIYLLLLAIEGIKISRSELELVFFTSFFVFWALLVTMKPVFLNQGFSVIFGGIPSYIRGNFFSHFTLLESMYKLGIIPVMYGLYSLFRFTFGKREKYVYMLVSLIYLMLVLLWFKLITVTSGFIFLGSFLIIVVILHYDWVFSYFNSSNKKTVRIFVKTLFIFYYVISFVLSSVLPSSTYLSMAKENIPTQSEIDMFLFMKKGIDNNSIVVAMPDYGQKIAYFSDKKTIMDSYYFGVLDSSRFYDVETVYTTNSLSTALSVIDKYDADYVLVSKSTKKYYNSTFPNYINSACFDLIKQIDDVFLFKARCKVVEFGT